MKTGSMSYPAIESVLQRRDSISALQARGAISDCRQQPDTHNSSSSSRTTSPPLAAELDHIRSWWQRRQSAAQVIAAAAADFLQRRAAQQQVFHSHLQWCKARRVLASWQQQAARRQQVYRRLTAMQAAFLEAAVDAWHAQSHGFHASKTCQEEGQYGVAAAFCDWRLRSKVLLGWAVHALGCPAAACAGGCSSVAG